MSNAKEPSIGRLVFGTVGVLIVLLIGVAGCNYAVSWGDKAAEVVSPENVEIQYTQVIEKFEALQDAANNACTASTVAKADGNPLLIEDPAQAYAATYRNIRTDYNRRQANLFEAKVVGPSVYPKQIPAFADAKPGGDWCAVADQIAELKR